MVLVGGDLVLEAGVLSAEGGRIELGAIDNGTVALNTDSTGLNLEYSDVPSFKNILLSERSLIDGSGKGISSIELQARDITLKNGSVILQQNQGTQKAGHISARASNSFTINGTDPVARILGSLWSETLG
ncbi:hypothetical protein B7486_51145, partial [cyanobacterium TDX16]